MTPEQSKNQVKELHPEAKKLAERYIGEFTNSLQIQAHMLADQEKDEIILSRHIQEALHIIYRRYKRSYNAIQEFSLIFWSAMLGFAISAFWGEILNQTNRVPVFAIAFFLTVVCLYMVFSSTCSKKSAIIR